MLALLSAALSFTLETSGSRERLRLELDVSSLQRRYNNNNMYYSSREKQ